MVVPEQLSIFFHQVLTLAANPANLVVLFGGVIMGIMFGAMPGLTSTLGVALLTTLTYGMETSTAFIASWAIFVRGCSEVPGRLALRTNRSLVSNNNCSRPRKLCCARESRPTTKSCSYASERDILRTSRRG